MILICCIILNFLIIFAFNNILLKNTLHSFCLFVRLLSINIFPIFFNIFMALSLKIVASISLVGFIFSKNKLNILKNLLLIIFLILLFLFLSIITSIICNKQIIFFWSKFK